MLALTPTCRAKLAAAREEAIDVLIAAMRQTEPGPDGVPVPTASARLAATTLIRLARDLEPEEEDEPAAPAPFTAAPAPAHHPAATPASAAPHHAARAATPANDSSVTSTLLEALLLPSLLGARPDTPAARLLAKAGAATSAPTSATATRAPPSAA